MLSLKSITPFFIPPLPTKVATGIIKPTMTADRLREMWVLYSHYYEVDQRSFFKKLEKNDYYALYTCGDNLIGFTGFRYKRINTPFGVYQTLYIGQSVMKEEFRGRSLMPRTCLKIFINHFLRYPFRPLYVWCDALTFKPYLLFANSMKEFYPTFKSKTPLKMKYLIHNLGKHFYDEYYLSEKGVVRKLQKSVIDSSADITEKDLKNPHIAYYEKRNPGHIHGNGLLVIAPVSFKNLWFLFKKCIRKKLG